MKKTYQNNFAFIDGQNFHLGIKSLGWKVDWGRFRKYLLHKYSAKKVYIFLGYVPKNKKWYDHLRSVGYSIVFKPTKYIDGTIKGNVDVDLVVECLVSIQEYDAAIVVTSDGDFYSLIEHLRKANKLKVVLSPARKSCSKLLKDRAQEKIQYCDDLRNKIGKRKNTPWGRSHTRRVDS